MISIGRLIAVGAAALAVRALWKRSQSAPRREPRAEAETVAETQPSFNTAGLAEEKPSLQ
jgi:hypothetical protein